jgi:hypothetical protein
VPVTGRTNTRRGMERKARWCAAQLRGELNEAASVGAASAGSVGEMDG